MDPKVIQHVCKRTAGFLTSRFNGDAVQEVFAQLLIRDQETEHAVALGFRQGLDFGNYFRSTHVAKLQPPLASKQSSNPVWLALIESPAIFLMELTPPNF